METSTKVYYFHGKTADGYRFTIAGRYQPLLENDQDQDVDVIMMGASLCGAKDQYVKKLGRVKAEGRMKQKDINGRTYYSLYGGETRPVNYFIGKESQTFVEVAQLSNALTRKGFMNKFNL